MPENPPTVHAAGQLRRHVSGAMLTRDDPGYDQARRGWGLAVDQHPALVVIPDDTSDVATAVRVARDTGLGVAVQSTGHGVLYPGDDSLLVVTSRLTSVHVDPAARTARVGAGATWQVVLDAATPHGLAPLLGSAPHVGVVGYVLGGGIGWLGRLYGFGCDSVRSFEIVTGDGRIRRTDATDHADLFWALRGGGGNFGIVTAVELDLHPVPRLYGGTLIYPEQHAREALLRYRDWIATLPDELTSAFAIVRLPHHDDVPEPLRGQVLAMVTGAYAGTAADGEKWLRPWREWRTPLEDAFREMPFAEVGAITNDPTEPVAEFGSSEMFDELSDEAVDVILRHATDASSPLTLNVLRHAGGAIARVAPEETAIGNRDASLYLLMAGEIPDPPARAAVESYVERYRTALRPHTRRGVWLNFMNGNGAGARQRIGEAYSPATHERLLAVKAIYDPDGLFRFSFPWAGTPA